MYCHSQQVLKNSRIGEGGSQNSSTTIQIIHVLARALAELTVGNQPLLVMQCIPYVYSCQLIDRWTRGMAYIKSILHVMLVLVFENGLYCSVE